MVFYICRTKKVFISSFDFFLHSKPFISDTIKKGGKIKVWVAKYISSGGKWPKIRSDGQIRYEFRWLNMILGGQIRAQVFK